MTLRAARVPLLCTLLLGSLGCSSVPGDEAFDLQCPGVLSHAANVHSFWVIGHRGAAGKEVENTLPSFERALADGANALELDLSLTKDGVVVLWHDWDPDSLVALGRQHGQESDVAFKPDVPDTGEDLRRPVDELTLAELREHYGYKSMDGDDAVEALIPTFDEFAAWARAEPRIEGVLLDIKAPEAKADLALELVKRTELILPLDSVPFERVYLTPYDPVWAKIDPLIEDAGLALDVDPGVVVVGDGDCKDASSSWALERQGGYASTVNPKSWGNENWKYLKDLVRCDLEARDSTQGLVAGVQAATVNDAEMQQCLMDMGVDGLTSDDPGKLYAEALANGRPVTPL